MTTPPDPSGSTATPAIAPAPAPNPHGRAGRNLAQAIGVGVGLGAMILLSLFLAKDSFAVIIALAMIVGVWELVRALAVKQIIVPIVPVAVGAAGMIFAAHQRGPEPLVVAFGLTCTAVAVWRVIDPRPGAGRDIAGGIFTAFYPCLLGGFAAMMLAADDGRARIITFILVTVCSDIGGYVAGVLFGRHPMAPKISPKKSWEGFAGSVLFCAIAGSACIAFLFDKPWWIGIPLGVLVAMCATIGDLMESIIKRDLGVKDMSNLLPGHGGLMDRLDSLLVCSPVVWAVLHYLVAA